MTIIITGGAGFIGSAVVRQYIEETDHTVVNVDKLTYAGTRESLESVSSDPRYRFEPVDVCDPVALRRIFSAYRPDAVMHLAAESHVDRSIDGPAAFVQTNIVGTSVLLEAAREYWNGLDAPDKARFRFHHVSTDEVFGALGPTGFFTEETPYRPSSPYSASKAASDHLVRAWHRTYGLPVVVSNCSNNYGPYQFPEKLIPLCTLRALEGKPLPVYGRGDNVRDWLYVDDHARALRLILSTGQAGQTYNVGGHNEKTNLEVVKAICALVDELAPDPGIGRRESLITFVQDRPGHDERYAIDAGKIERALGWRPQETFETGLRKTVRWFIDNAAAWQRVTSARYALERLGLQASS